MTRDHGSFQGVFDGDGHTISNLYVEQAGDGLGLFARTAGNAEIKNVNLENVTLKSTNNANYLGGLVGNAYASTKITNIHVSGDVYISGRGYLGGIAGHGYVVMDNVSVKANANSLITSTFWCAGGILGYGGEGIFAPRRVLVAHRRRRLARRHSRHCPHPDECPPRPPLYD